MRTRLKLWTLLGLGGLLLLVLGAALALAVEFATSERNLTAVSLLRELNGEFEKIHGPAKSIVLVALMQSGMN
jgi:hypothetical protein